MSASEIHQSVLTQTLAKMKAEWTAPLRDELNQANADLRTLSSVLRDIADIASENVDVDSPWNEVAHLCSLAAARGALHQ